MQIIWIGLGGFLGNTVLGLVGVVLGVMLAQWLQGGA